jgi:hypothetical protein
MKKMLIPLLIVGFLMFSFAAVAQNAPAPAQVLNSIGEFIKELFNPENAGVVTFIFYFLLLLFIFIEFLSLLPFFGRTGELNGAGKGAAASMAGLSAIGIFVGQKVTGKTGLELAQQVLAPFGIFGAFVVAASLSGITFLAIRNFEVFRDRIMMAMALAASVGLAVAGYIVSSSTLFGWAYVLVLIVMVVGFIMTLSGRANSASSSSSPSQVRSFLRGGSDGEAAEPEKPSKAKKRQRMEKAEESFAVEELDGIKNAIDSIDKIRANLAALPKEGLKPNNVKKATSSFDKKVEQPVKESARWADKARRLGKKILKAMRRSKKVKMSKKEEVVLSDVQKTLNDIKSILSTDIPLAKESLEAIRKKKIRTRDDLNFVKVNLLPNADRKLSGLRAKLQKVLTNLGVIFSAQKKIEKEDEAATVQQEVEQQQEEQ